MFTDAEWSEINSPLTDEDRALMAEAVNMLAGHAVVGMPKMRDRKWQILSAKLTMKEDR